MPNQRKKGKKLVGFFATEEEAAALHKAAENEGVSVADFLRGVIRKAEARLPKSSKREVK